jgi:hypothetical protein
MATSGSIDFQLTRDQVINEAMEMLGVLPEGVVANAAQLASGSTTLNMMLKAWQSKATQLWVNQRLYLFLQPGKREYNLDLTAASSDECTTSFTAITLDGDHTSGATAILVSDGSTTNDADRIGILVDDQTMHFTTIASGGGTNSLVLTVGLDDDASDGATIYFYTTKAARPRKINVATSKNAPAFEGRDNVIDGTEIPVEVMARQDWADLSVKRTGGRTNQLYWDPQWQTGIVRVWPQPNIGSDYLVLWVERTIEDVDIGADDFDLPQEWLLAVSSSLALWLTTKFGVSDKTFGRVNALAQLALFDAESGDTEGNMRFTPDDRWDGYNGTY